MNRQSVYMCVHLRQLKYSRSKVNRQSKTKRKCAKARMCVYNSELWREQASVQ
ncbi:hypothetical protein AG1IA_05772 [Rhizoctonia solani AG-1 IA]|uniref:Uncharacterized protein n=1 Tax=Thanatephorus cucumeris (strain AG1-IA) TaxID=983506 RepID=L8WQB1_THACA|nr:hypothetical protein AG1IA_05772 [Rhizoctonia solani AG-1 IA]